MKIQIVTPAPPGSLHGNRVTAERWTEILRALGHEVEIRNAYAKGPCDLLIALHARKSFDAVARHCREASPRPVIVALTGTDLYDDIRHTEPARESLRLATRLIVLQPQGLSEIPAAYREKTRVILQSMPPALTAFTPREDGFYACVIGHLRKVKDPLRAAMASRLRPPGSRLRVIQIGAAMEPQWAQHAKEEAAQNPRYRWLGEVSREAALEHLARSHVLVLSSRMEGGANVISEAVVTGVPILASRIPGSVGLLGAAYPGYFELEDTAALAALLARAEEDSTYYSELRAWIARLQPLFEPARERDSWARLLAELPAAPMSGL